MSDLIGWPDLTDRHSSTVHFVKLFEVGHLPEPMRTISLYCGHLAAAMMHELGDGPELTAGLRKLREAKDCFVTQRVIDRDAKED